MSQIRWGEGTLEEDGNGTELVRRGGGDHGRWQLATELQSERKMGLSQESPVLLVTGWPFLKVRPLSTFIWILKNRSMLKEVHILSRGPGGPSGSQQLANYKPGEMQSEA